MKRALDSGFCLFWVLSLNLIGVYFQPIEACLYINIFSELLNSSSSLFLPYIDFLFCFSLVPIKPVAGEPKRVNLTKGEKEAFSLSSELTDIIIGLILGDLNIQKDKRAF